MSSEVTTCISTLRKAPRVRGRSNLNLALSPNASSPPAPHCGVSVCRKTLSQQWRALRIKVKSQINRKETVGSTWQHEDCTVVFDWPLAHLLNAVLHMLHGQHSFWKKKTQLLPGRYGYMTSQMNLETKWWFPFVTCYIQSLLLSL